MVTTRKLVRLLKALEQGPLSEGQVNEDFSEETILMAFKKEYIKTELTCEGCPPEMDKICLTSKGKKWLNNPSLDEKEESLDQLL